MMTAILAIAFGGAIGSVARYGMSLYSVHLVGLELPYGIFLTNVIGSLAICICFVLIVECPVINDIWHSILMIGFLGGFTTFSTFSLQSIELNQAGRTVEAFVYILGSLVLSILGCCLGIMAARALN